MTRRRTTPLRITGPEVDLEREMVLDAKGRRVDQAYVEQALADVELELRRRAGRPSLTGEAVHSPHVTFRVSPEMKARAEAEAVARGTTVSQLAREALERFLAS